MNLLTKYKPSLIVHKVKCSYLSTSFVIFTAAMDNVRLTNGQHKFSDSFTYLAKFHYASARSSKYVFAYLK